MACKKKKNEHHICCPEHPGIWISRPRALFGLVRLTPRIRDCPLCASTVNALPLAEVVEAGDVSIAAVAALKLRMRGDMRSKRGHVWSTNSLQLDLNTQGKVTGTYFDPAVQKVLTIETGNWKPTGELTFHLPWSDGTYIFVRTNIESSFHSLRGEWFHEYHGKAHPGYSGTFAFTPHASNAAPSPAPAPAPVTASANLHSIFFVRGAGTAAVNGRYVESSPKTSNYARSFYKDDGSHYGLHCTNTAYAGCPQGWWLTTPHNDNGIYYHAQKDASTPPKSGWTIYRGAYSTPGSSPAPNVSSK